MIDQTTLNELLEAIGDSFAELVTVFIQDTSSMLEQLPGLVAAGDEGEVRRLAHSMKSSSAIFGGTQLSDLARILEDQAAAGDLSSASEQVKGLEEAFVPVRKELEEKLAQM
ncbi:MAG: Hpt domain-containing protein [Thermodesulfobacteriota bacterium]